MAYNKKEEKPLSQLMAERKEYYQTKMQKVFDNVYGSGNFQYIEQFEKTVLSLSDGDSSRGKLEKIVSASNIKNDKEEKKRLTFSLYKNCRNSGMANGEIKDTYKLESNYQLIGFGKRYAALKKPKRAYNKQDDRPVLTYKLYEKCREDGMTNDQIKAKFKVKGRKMGGFAGSFSRYHAFEHKPVSQ